MAEAGVSLPIRVVEEISARLSRLKDLRLPYQLQNNTDVSQAQKEQYLQALLLRDPGVFLERHGTALSSPERDSFIPLNGDYEVDFWLRQLQPSAETPVQSHTIRNRRAAALQNLEQGTFFSEEEMRERAPLLHHQYIGQYDDAAPVPKVDNNKLSESILQQHDELSIRSRLVQEQRALDEEELDDSEEEEDEEDLHQRGEPEHKWEPSDSTQDGEQTSEETQPRERGPLDSPARLNQVVGDAGIQQGPILADGQGGEDLGRAANTANGGGVLISNVMRAEYREEFVSIMKARFLAGEEEGVDYDAIDQDASLDEHWAKEEQQDAEDKYFDTD